MKQIHIFTELNQLWQRKNWTENRSLRIWVKLVP